MFVAFGWPILLSRFGLPFIIFCGLGFVAPSVFAFDPDQAWESIDLWTASASRNEPESVFGHSALRIRTKDRRSEGFVIQFVADVPPDRPISYYKGVVGDYPFKIEIMSSSQFVFNTLKSSRSLSQLRLRLNRHEIHALQILFIYLMENQARLGQYTFFAKNCAQAISDFVVRARIPLRGALMRGRVPVLLQDAFILSRLNLGKPRQLIQLPSIRLRGERALHKESDLDLQDRIDLLVWYLADRDSIGARGHMPQVLRKLGPQSSVLIQLALAQILFSEELE